MADDLVEFLRARLDDDERRARTLVLDGRPVENPVPRRDLPRVLADIDAKRRIIDHCEAAQIPIRDDWSTDELAGDVLAALALPYADHPGYRKEWRP